MRHLTSLKELSKDEILELLDLADNFIDSEGSIRRDPLFPDKKVVNIFCEPAAHYTLFLVARAWISPAHFCTGPCARDKKESIMRCWLAEEYKGNEEIESSGSQKKSWHILFSIEKSQ